MHQCTLNFVRSVWPNCFWRASRRQLRHLRVEYTQITSGASAGCSRLVQACHRCLCTFGIDSARKNFGIRQY